MLLHDAVYSYGQSVRRDEPGGADRLLNPLKVAQRFRR